ncbi:MAG: hypothetical protein IIC07_06510 [Proteobacteria bacterium]|nr:hypothetical protein [Pseudomonadota bacterium]
MNDKAQKTRGRPAMLSNAFSAASGYPRSRGMLIKLSPYEQNPGARRGSGKISLPAASIAEAIIPLDPNLPVQ